MASRRSTRNVARVDYRSLHLELDYDESAKYARKSKLSEAAKENYNTAVETNSSSSLDLNQNNTEELSDDEFGGQDTREEKPSSAPKTRKKRRRVKQKSVEKPPKRAYYKVEEATDDGSSSDWEPEQRPKRPPNWKGERLTGAPPSMYIPWQGYSNSIHAPKNPPMKLADLKSDK
ncbi:unnamed protein product [Caenorhabditis bovis]|uniref:Uncharacterized protein n=1 Tax=Caenorhabditis bovis TaxID=2654633 RepID=A0A8S1E6C9_9PELO|nr:unnamed protein product [Caenorhabditis bovis]